jgi:hypothetical protein
MVKFSKWLESVETPAILYHGTLPGRLEDIMQRGILPKLPRHLRIFPEAKEGVYLAKTPEDAKFWAINQGNIGTGGRKEAVVLAVKTSMLDQSLLEPDENTVGAFVYQGTILPTQFTNMHWLEGFHDLPAPKYGIGDRVRTLSGEGVITRLGGGGKTDHFGISAPKTYFVKLDSNAKYGWGGKEIEFDVADVDLL